MSHEFMADHYTGIMQAAIRKVHPRLNDNGFLNGYDNNSLWDWDPSTGDGGYTPPTLPEPEEMAVKIEIDPKLAQDYPCFAEQVQQTYALCSDLNIDFLEYFESSEDFNVIYSYEDLNSNASAVSTNPVHCTFPCTTKIVFNQDFMGTMSDLSIATTTIHENTHAMLFYLWRAGEINLSSQNPTYRDLAQAYCNLQASEDFENGGTQQTLEDLGHEYMVDLTDKIAGTLFNYASSQDIDVDMDYCRKMIWGGTFSKLESYEKFSSDERKEIAAIVNAEKNSKTYTYQLSDGSIQTTTAKGEAVNSSSCN